MKLNIFQTKRLLIIFSIIIFFSKCTQAPSPLYSDKNISIFPDKIEQNKFTSEAISDTYLVSTYHDSISKERVWKLNSNISEYPTYKSDQILLDALYKLSLDLLNKSAFSSKSKKYTTKEISNSVILSLAILKPEEAKLHMLSRVINNNILQDKNISDSWPISTDRILWTIASWELYKTTGDEKWLKTIFPIIKNSIDNDLDVIWNTDKQLFRGKSSAASTSYPSWMKSTDIFNSYSLNIQAIYYQSLLILVKTGQILNKDIVKYKHLSSSLKKSINKHFWSEDDNHYGNLLFSSNANILNSHRDILGESLGILFNIFDNKNILKTSTSSKFGIYTEYPPSKKDNIYAYIQAFHNWASAKEKEQFFVEKGIASLIRSSALTLNNFAEYSHVDGQLSKSNNNLTGISSNLSVLYRIFLGLDYKENDLNFFPFIPREYKGKKTIKNFKYRASILDIEIIGFGDAIQTFSVDGVFQTKARIKATLEGKHIIEIKMNNKFERNNKCIINNNSIAINTPELNIIKNKLSWTTESNTKNSIVYINGEDSIVNTRNNYILIDRNKYSAYTVINIDTKNNKSFLSKPLEFIPSPNKKIIKLNNVILNKGTNLRYSFNLRATHKGRFLIKYKYINANKTNNKTNVCALRSMWKRKTYLGTIVFPYTDDKRTQLYTNSILVEMKKGMNNFSLDFRDFNKNMNYTKNQAIITEIHITALDK